MSLIVGIDPSLTATGIVVLRDGQVELARVTPNKPELDTLTRVFMIHHIITSIIENLKDETRGSWSPPDMIVIEGFSYGSKGRSVFDIAYLGWRIREELDKLKREDGIPWMEVPPTTLKKYATGKGNSSKEIILQQVYKRWGYETHDNNIADAYVLAQIGEAYCDNCVNDTAPDFQQKVINDLKKMSE